MSLHVYDQWPKPSYLAYFFYMSWHHGCPPWQTCQFGSKEVTGNRRSWHAAIWLARFWGSVPRATSPFHSGDGERTNRRDAEANNRGAAVLSDGLNVTDLRASACEGQAWRAAEQRGPPGWCPIKNGGKKKRKRKTGKKKNWLVAPDTSPPLLSRAPAAAAAAAGLLSPPYSSSLPASKPVSLFITPPPCVWSDRIIRLTLSQKSKSNQTLFVQRCSKMKPKVLDNNLVK